MTPVDWGVYVHVPWCRAVCPYCAFAVQPAPGPVDAGPWLAHLLRHWDARRGAFPGRPATLFFGGGTPSRLPPDAIARVVDAVAPRGEVTVEANPEDVTPAWLSGAVRAGVGRLSLGVQSFDPARARRLGRARSHAVAHEVVRRVADAVPTFAVDLMFAVPPGPGRPAREPLAADLERAVDLGVPHVSLYGLTIEEGTRFGAAAARGALAPVDPEAWRAAYDGAVRVLRAAGLPRYEVSNFARPGHQSAHNRLYWTDAPYLGLGPSAHGYLPDGARTVEHRDLATWLAAPPEPATTERPPPRARATDLLVSALRSVDGVDRARLRATTGLDVDVPSALVRGGLLDVAGDRLRLTDDGFPLCDAVVSRLVEALSPAAATRAATSRAPDPASPTRPRAGRR